MQFRAHRGNSAYAPENTMPAFCLALEEGFESIETDPNYTKDGVVVLMHDGTINRTCRNSDGSPIDRPVIVTDTTYEELMQYDAGIFMGEKFRGTRIPRLEELLAIAEAKDVVISLDKKIPTGSMDVFFDVIERFKTRTEFSCADTKRIKTVLERFPNALINYDGSTTEEELEEVCSLVKKENLTVWMYLDKPNFAWLTDRVKASPENCARVKKYARLGIANVTKPADVREAYLLGADIIEV